MGELIKNNLIHVGREMNPEIAKSHKQKEAELLAKHKAQREALRGKRDKIKDKTS